MFSILFPSAYDFSGRPWNYSWYLKQWRILDPKPWKIAWFRVMFLVLSWLITAQCTWLSLLSLLDILALLLMLILMSNDGAELCSCCLYWSKCLYCPSTQSTRYCSIGFSHWLAMSHHTSLSSHYWQRVIDNFPWQWARLEESTYLYFQ